MAYPIPAAFRLGRPRAAAQALGGGAVIDSPEKLEAFMREGDTSSAGPPVTAETAMRVAAVYGCIRIIAGAVATLPLDIKRRVDERTRQEASDHPLYEVLRRRPNGWMKPAAFRRMMQAHLLLRGNAYCRIVRGSRRQVMELLPMHPDRVRPEQMPDLSVRYHYQRADGATVVFPQADVFHLTGMTLDGVKGVSVLTYARESIGLALATSRHGASFFRNGANIGSLIKHPNKIGNEAREHLKASLEAYRGAENAGKTLVLEEGAEFTPIGMSAEDAQFVETMRLSEGEIAMFFGVPPHMLGMTEKTTSWGSGIEQQSLGFVAYTLEDWLTGWEDGINVDLVRPDEPDIYARFNRAALVRGDLKTRWDAHVKALQWGVRSPNEVRTIEDENPREGGDIYYPPPNTAGATDKPAAEEKDGNVDPPPA